MHIRFMAASGYTAISAGVALFQIALAAGAPWGTYAMGGAFPGQFPPVMRIAAVVQAALMMLMSAVVLSRAGIALPAWSRASRWLVWLIVTVGAASLTMNIATPSSGERIIWAPVAFLLLTCSVLVATSKPPQLYRDN
jgi:hypothetical protein